jgi:hypothetical protein
MISVLEVKQLIFSYSVCMVLILIMLLFLCPIEKGCEVLIKSIPFKESLNNFLACKDMQFGTIAIRLSFILNKGLSRPISRVSIAGLTFFVVSGLT